VPVDPNRLVDVPLFAGLWRDELERVASWMEARHGALGERILGESGPQLDGLVQDRRRGAAGEPREPSRPGRDRTHAIATPRAFTTRIPFVHRSSPPRTTARHHDASDRMTRVLIIEDDDVIAQGMARHLHAAGFDAVGVANGETGLARLRYERPDVCVLDLMLPGVDGWKVIEQARGEGIGTPIVVVSARGTEHDRVHALEIGADDYLVKPFSMRELVARVGAAARRGTRAQDPRRGEEIVIEELRLDPRNVQAYVEGTSADLTPTEFRLVYALALEAGRVLTRDELLQRVWGRRASHRDRTVDVFVRKLREKIDARAPRHTFLQTRYGVGYKLEAEPK
jgi:two-component system alkaline phosphatase synthesis response regulator PhoP